jgi:hypothetical protein
MRLKNWSKVIAGALVLSAATLPAACTRSVGDPVTPTSSVTSSTPAPTTDSSTATVDQTIAEDEAAILDAYRSYWAAKVTVLADTTVDPGPTLGAKAVGTARSGVLETLLTYRTNRIDMVGEPVLHPEVSDIVPGAKGTATITDCVDVADWQPIFRDTGEPAAAPGQATDVLTVSTAHFYDARWTIRTSVVDLDTPC